MKQSKFYFAGLLLLAASAALLALLLSITPVSAAGEFTTTWQTDVDDPSDVSITLPVYKNPRYSYSYTVDWGDGSSTFYDGAADGTHTYAAPGTYQVKISGDYPRIYMNNHRDAKKLISIDAWGDVQWESFGRAFSGASNLTIKAADVPDLSQVNNTIAMFSGATSLTGGVGNWDVSTIATFTDMFKGASSFDEDLSSWDFSSMQIATSMFDGAGLSTLNYDRLLESWSTNSPPSGIDLSNTTLVYCNAQSARSTLVTTYNWTITGDSFDAAKCAPTDIYLVDVSEPSVEEGVSNALIGQLASVDSDGLQNHTYSLGCSAQAFPDAGFFSIIGRELRATTTFDFSSPQDTNGDNNYELCVTSTDINGSSIDKVFSVAVTEAPEEETVSEENQNQGGQVLGDSTSNTSSDDGGDLEPEGQVLGAADEEAGKVLAETGLGIALVITVGASLSLLASYLMKTDVVRKYKLKH